MNSDKLTQVQFRFTLVGLLFCCAATAFAIFVQPAIGLIAILVTAFFLGYMASSKAHLDSVSRRASHLESYLVFSSLALLLLYISLVIVDFTTAEINSSAGRVYATMVIAAAAISYCNSSLLGRLIRARWNGFRI